MFSSKSKTERTAAQAWDYLTAAMTAASEAARDTSGKAAKFAGKASDEGHRFAGKAGGKADVAWSRANAAAAALAGRKPSRPWGLIVGAGLLGVAVGYAVAVSARTALEMRAEQEELELAETAVVVTPTFDK
ncbi:hypothetical protein [Actinoplanes solisilvae]|uniref:hypothetical protein n=1 Tax=Actinoplanes solisilvae TaxID=2486853 RepID=UPI000FD9C1E3|nr:hypothetical protein [Actinoplanes solisilvae]